MAARYWVGVAGAVWNATVGTKWATTSGGAGGASVPTAADDVYFDANSTANATTAGSIVCRSLNFTGYTKQFTFASGVTLTIGDGTAGAGNVALKMVSGMTVIDNSATVVFVSTSATQQTITTAAKTMPPITFNGAGSSYILGDALTCKGITHTAGTFNTGNYNITFPSGNGLTSSGTTSRTLTLGTSTITIGIVGSAWSISGSNLVASMASSTINVTYGVSSSFAGGSQTYGTVNISLYDQLTLDWTVTITGANTFGSLTVNQFSTGAGMPFLLLPSSTTTTVTGTLSVVGSGVGARIGVGASGGGQATLSHPVGNVVFDSVVISNLAAVGEAKYFATNSLDNGNNTNWRFHAPTGSRQALLGCGI